MSIKPNWEIFPSDTLNHVYSYLSTVDILNTSLVCKTWYKDRKLPEKRSSFISEAAEQNRWILNLLKNHQLSLRTIPTLPLPAECDGWDYIDYLDRANVDKPIMKFEDRLGRVGIALRLRGRDKDQLSSLDDKQKDEISNMQAVLPIFSDHGSWGCGYNCARNVLDTLHSYRSVYRDPGPPSRGHLYDSTKIAHFVEGLLKGKDPLFQIEGYVAPKTKNDFQKQKAILITAVALAVLVCVVYQSS